MFLDRETTKIDNLIASKEHVIALFEERRIALISSAVTRGVSTNKTAVPSADWLDDIPSSWSLLPFRRALTGIEQGWSPQADQRSAEGDEWAVLKVGAVYKGRFRPEEHKALPADLEPETRFEVREGDLLLTRGNTPELVADACVVPATRDRLMLSDLHYRLTLDERRLLKRFACYWLISRAGRQQIEADAHGTSNSMVKVSQRDIRSWIVPLPRLDEQERIATFLDEQSRQTDAMISRIAEGITRLREYRSSLISVAVTGQIDVRSYRPEATCQ
jgi:type I restriction enzyme S subunit